MDLAGAQQELANRGFNYLDSGRMTIMLNIARNEFEDFWPWPWLEQTITGPAPLAAPRLKYVLYVQNTDLDVELLHLDVRQIAQNGTPLDLAGIPAYWWLDGPTGPDDTAQINTWPIGAATIQARIVAESPELALGTDTPLIPARYHPLWIDYAVIRGYIDSDNFAAASALRADVTTRMQDVVTRYETRNRQTGGYRTRRVAALDD